MMKSMMGGGGMPDLSAAAGMLGKMGLGGLGGGGMPKKRK